MQLNNSPALSPKALLRELRSQAVPATSYSLCLELPKPITPYPYLHITHFQAIVMPSSPWNVLREVHSPNQPCVIGIFELL